MTKAECIAVARKYLENNDWDYEFVAENDVIKCGVKLNCKLQSVRLILDFYENDVCIFAISPLNANPKYLNEMYRYLFMANSGLKNGNFELDVSDGEIRYKTYLRTKELPTLPDELIEGYIYGTVMMCERYGDGIAALAMGFSDADTEIQMAEQN